MKNYKIAVAGTGYVGLSLGVLFAQHHQVVAVDIVQAKVDMINNKKSPIQDSPKGSMLLDMIKNQVNISQIDTQQEIKLDGRKINESVQKNPNSIIFFNDARTLPYDVLVKKWVPDSKKEMLVTIIKRHAKNLPFLKKMIKKVRS